MQTAGQGTPGQKPLAAPLPRQRFDERLLWQTYRYDWLGNSVASDDDAHGFYDRSLGAIENGTPTAGPYQFQAASNETAGNLPREGKLTAKYDAAGYLTDLALNRTTLNGSCLPLGKPCHQRFRYDWDEVGRLSRARRWDLTAPSSAHDPLPAQDVAVELRHSYDGGDMRVVKEATTCIKASALSPCSWATVHTVYLFDSLELRRAYFTAATGEADYEATGETEAAYLVANGVRLARLHHEPTLPAVGGEGLHVLLELADHLGSGAIVLDKATGELAERITYQGYGSVESDYRPGRWGAFREDYRFTGKEEDSEVGLTYFGFRYLNTALGRWASADPLTIHQLGADLNAYAYVHGRVLAATDPVGLEAEPRQEKADLSGLAVNGVVPDRALVVPGQQGYIGATGSDYEKFRSLAKVEYVHDASAVPIELKKITILLGDGAKPESKAAREFGYLGALVAGQGQEKNAPGASANGVVGGTNPDGLEGAGWQVGIAAVNIAGVLGVVDALIARGAGMAARGVSALGRKVKAIQDLVSVGDDLNHAFGKEISNDLKHLQPKFNGPVSTEQREKFLESAMASFDGKRGSPTNIGRAIQKHSTRPNSFFKSQAKNPKEYNAFGQEFVESLLRNPNAITKEFEHQVHGMVINVRLKNGAGAQFKKSGEFVGLLEPYSRKP